MIEGWKFSKYNIVLKKDNICVLYNTLHTGIIGIDKRIEEIIQEGKIEDLNDDELSMLIDNKFIVKSDINELSMYSLYYNTERFVNSRQSLSITIIPTYNCNLSCPYCYQGQYKEIIKLDNNKLEAIIAFIENCIVKSYERTPIKEVFLNFYGGEPLLCKDSIVFLCDKASSLKEKYDFQLSFEITTNFTLLDNEFLKIMGKYQIHVQVSIDGNRDEHDRSRIYKNGKGTYDLILHNLDKVVKNGLKNLITIRCNVGQNYQNASALISDLKPYSDDIYFGILEAYESNTCFHSNCISKENVSTITTEVLNDALVKNGLNCPQLFGKKSPCALNSFNRYMIDPYLNVYKCDLLVNHPDYRAGYLTSSGDFVEEGNYYEQMYYSPFNDKECLDCKLLPLCGGCCPGRDIIQKGFKGGYIKRASCDFTEKALQDYVIDYVKRINVL